MQRRRWIRLGAAASGGLLLAAAAAYLAEHWPAEGAADRD